MNIEIKPVVPELQKKLIGVATRNEEPRIALLLEGNVIFFVDTDKGEILIPKKKEEEDGGGQLDEMREGNVSEELQAEATTDGQGPEDSQGPSGEV